MKECEWCGREMARSNYQRHLGACIYYNDLKIKKSDIEFLKKQRPREKSDMEQLASMELINFLTEYYNKSKLLYNRVVVENSRDPLEKIKEMNVSSPTMKNYVTEWKQYTKYLKKNNKAISVDSANSYIGSLDDKCASTNKNKHSMLQVLLKHLVDPNIKLNKFSRRVSYKPKRALNEEELMAYLEEQKNINSEDYLIQLLMATYGLRVNTIALLTISDLEFLEARPNEEQMIHLPDSKTKNRRVETIGDKLKQLLYKQIGQTRQKNKYVFYHDGRSLDFRRRAQDIGTNINKRIKDSKVLNKRGDYQYTSHMFRKTLAYNMFNKQLKKLKDKVRASIGQSKGSHAIEHYIK
jgi:integrase